MRTAITIMEIFKFIAICSIVMISWSLLLTILSISGKISLGFIESLPIYSGGSSQLMIVPRLWNGIITGSFCSAFSIIFSAIYFFDRNNEYRKLFGVASLFTFVGLAISFSRGPVIGFIVGVALFYIVTMKRYFMRNIGILMKAIIAVLSIYFIFSLSPIGKSIGNIAIGRIIQAMTISEYKTGTASYRLQLWMPLITDIQNNPFVGQGALAYKKHAMDGGSSENVPLEIFHSTGIIGFLAYIWIHIHIIRLFFKRSNRNWFTIACVGAVVSLFVASLTNPFAWFPLYWLFLGLLIAINNKFSFINKSSYIPLNSNQQIIQMK